MKFSSIGIRLVEPHKDSIHEGLTLGELWPGLASVEFDEKDFEVYR